MINHSNQYKGFSLVEIMVSMIILVIAIVSVFAVFISIARLRAYSVNEIEAYYNAASWLERVRVEKKYGELNDGENRDIDATAPASILLENYNNWPMAHKPKVNMQNAEYTIEDVNLGSGEMFKKITAEVQWDELQ